MKSNSPKDGLMEKLAAILCLVLLIFSISFRKRVFLSVSAAVLGLLLIFRTFQVGYPPLFDPFDSIMLFALTFIVVSVLLKLSVRVAGVISLFFVLPLLFVKSSVHLLPPIVRTPLFIIHVSTAMIGYALFIVASLISVLNVVYKENFNVRKVASWGLLFFSASLIVGGIWAFLAWADLFPIEPKSLFSILTWTYFALLVHFKFDKDLSRFRDAAFIFGGFLVLFTFLGVNFLMRGTHAF